MKYVKKFLICIMFILAIIIINTQYTYAVTSTGKLQYGDLFNYKLKNLKGKRMDDETDSWGAGFNSCCQHENAGTYSIHIATAYETVYDGTSGTIVGNSWGIEMYGVTKKKVKDPLVRKLAAAMSLDNNIQGVRDALLQCQNQDKPSESLLTYSKAMSYNNDDGSEYGGSSNAWETSGTNARLIENYQNYQKLKKVKTGEKATMSETTVDNVEYVQFGPFQMKYGTAKMDGYTINGVKLDGTGKFRFLREDGVVQKYANTGVVIGKDKNKKDIRSETEFVLSNKKFYLLVEKNFFEKKVITSETKTIKIKFKQEGFKYNKGRVVVCQNGAVGGAPPAGQASVWYEYREVNLNGGSIQYNINFEDTGEKVKITKVNTAGNPVPGVNLWLYGVTDKERGWVNEEGKLTSDISAADVYITGDDGTITACDLPKGKYYAYEIEVPEGYNLEDQRAVYPDANDPNGFAGKDEYDNCVYIGERDSSVTPDEGKIIQYQYGSLNIQKVVGDTGIKGISLRIYGQTSNGNGWLVSDGTLRNSYTEGTVYTTGDDGKVTAGNLRRGTYYIYEYSVPEPYHIEEQRILYPNSNDPLGIAGNGAYGNCVYIGNSGCYSTTTEVKLEQRETPLKQITIEKKDKITGQKIENVGFKVLQKLSRYIVQNGITYNQGTYVWLKSDGTITTNVAEASEIKTNANGLASISNIRSIGQCYAYEVSTGTGYEMEDQPGYMQGKPGDYPGTFLSGTWAYMGSVTINQNTDTIPVLTLTAYNQKSRGSLNITKTDGTYSGDLNVQETLYLGGAKMKIYGESSVTGSKGWIKAGTYASGTIKYDYGSYNEATEFTTDASGRVNVYNLLFGTYYIYETKAPDGYDIKKQDGYKVASNGSSEIGVTDWAYLGSASVSYNVQNVSYDIFNKRYISIKGKVWVDVPGTKNNLADNLFDSASGDRLLGDVTVNLYDIRTNERVATTKTGNNGEYEFKTKINGAKITYWNAAYYYLEFIYDNRNYISVTPFAGDSLKITNNSKAQEEEITNSELNDAALTGTSGDLPGKAITYKGVKRGINKNYIEQNATKTLSERLLTGYIDTNTNSIENINLGLVAKATTEHSVGQSIEYVKIQKGNYTFKYKYGETAVTEQGTKISTVNFQNSKKSFTQSLHPSDILYNMANGRHGNDDDAYKVYVVYRIDIKNTTTLDLDDLYKEEKFYLTSLTNTFDTSRYELSKQTSGDKQEISKHFNEWRVTRQGEAQYNISSNTKLITGLGKNETGTAYIEFKVKDEALKKLITEKQLSESPTVVVTSGYHKYQRKDKNWKNNNMYIHRSVYEKNTNGSLYLKWKLFDTRTISGTIFEDTKDENKVNERIGNGRYDEESEKKVSGVVVSLMNINGETADLYEDELRQNITTGNWQNCKKKAVVQVKYDGTYTLKGVVPGKYYLKFTYGDGRSKVTDLNGRKINVETKIRGRKIDSNYYKSTILKGSVKDSSNQYWYLNSIGRNYSVASDSKGTYYDSHGQVMEKNGRDYYDIIDARTTSTQEINNKSSKNTVVIDAVSPIMDIKFEYTRDNEKEVGSNGLRTLKNNCTGMSFGIIERPHVNITLEKKISSVKLTLTDGSTIINEDIASQNVNKGIAVINESNVKVETEYANLYGATLTIEYKIVATNESELDYATRDYYQTGKKSGVPVSTTVTKIIDYLSYTKGEYSDFSDNVNVTESYENEGYRKADYFVNGVIESNKEYKNQLLVTATEELMPKSYNQGKKQAVYEFKTTRLIPSSTEEEMGMESYAEIIGIKNVTFTTQYSSTMGSYKAGDRKTVAQGGTSEPDNGQAILTVSPPTGSDRSGTYWIAGIIALSALAGGLVLIKKKILNK